MFPHEIDKYRIVTKLLWVEKETYYNSRHQQVGLGQKVLAEKSDVSQPTISNVLNLEKSLESPKRRVSRRDLLKVLTWGLGLPQQKVDSLLWLFDGRVLAEDEVRRYVKGYIPKSAPEVYSDTDLRGFILDWLQKSFAHSSFLIEQGAKRAMPAKPVPTGDHPANLAAIRELDQMESIPGQRMLVMRYPSFLLFPPREYPVGGSSDIASEFRALNEKRVNNIACFGERSVHHKESIEKYINHGPEHLDRESRKEQVRRWIGLLQSSKYPHYEVGLSDTPLAMEVTVKTTAPTMVGAMVNEEPPWVSTGWKLQWIKLFDETTALGIYLDFERQWDRICDGGRTNSQVMEFLKHVLNEA